jgi:uncharacterized protein YbjT (DUF2867 family)
MIVVTTPTGQIGQHVVRGLLAAGEQVRVIVRDRNRLPGEVLEQVQVVEGNHNDPAITLAAFEGAEAVFYVVPPDPSSQDVREHYRAFAESAAAAVTAHGVRRVVAVTTLGRGYDAEAGHLSAALEAEPILEATGVDYRALAMPFFMDNLLAQASALKEQGMFYMPNTADQVLLVIATPDIAQAAVAQLLDSSWTGQDIVPVVSPDRLTPTQMAEVISDVLGSPVSYQQVSTEQYIATLSQYGMSPAWVQGLADMATAQNEGIYTAQTQHLDDAAPTSFRTWCENALTPAVRNASSQW